MLYEGYTLIEVKAYFKGVEFDLEETPTKEQAQAMLLYLNSLGDAVFVKEGTMYEPENDVNNVDLSEVGYWFKREIEYILEDWGAEGLNIMENGLEVFAE